MSNKPDRHPEFFDHERLPEGWELLAAEEHKRLLPRYTGERIARDRQRYDAIVQALSTGIPVDWIVKGFHVHPSTVAAIAQREKTSIEEQKKSMGAEMLRAARMSVQSFMQDLVAGKVTAKDKAIAAGIFTDKGLLLQGQATSIVETRRAELTPDAVNGFWQTALKQKGPIEVAAIEDQAPATDSQSPGLDPIPEQTDPHPSLANGLANTQEAPGPTPAPDPTPAPQPNEGGGGGRHDPEPASIPMD